MSTHILAAFFKAEIFTNSIEENEHMNIARSHEDATPIIGGEFAPFSEYKWYVNFIFILSSQACISFGLTADFEGILTF